jgi:hypothetical protein
VGHRCRACGGEARGGRWLEMAADVEAVPRWRRRWWLDERLFPDLLTVVEWVTVPERREWHRKSLGTVVAILEQEWRR